MASVAECVPVAWHGDNATAAGPGRVGDLLTRVATVDTGGPRGMIMIAIEPIEPGELVLREHGLALCPGYVDPLASDGGKIAARRVATWFEALTESQQTDIMSLCRPQVADTTSAAIADAYMRLNQQPWLTARGFAAVMVINLNACKTEAGPALCKLASRMNHSCNPSCCWYTDTESPGKAGPRAVRAVRLIAEGAEITISYSLHQLRTGP